MGLRFDDGTQGIAAHPVGPALPAMPGEQVTVSWDPRHQAIVPDRPGDPAPEAVPASA